MADKIKKFFQKKKADAKFKMAGPGHKLSESSSKASSSGSVPSVVMPKRTGLTTESQVAAEAALARLQQTRTNPSFNTSLAAVKAQVKKELENEDTRESLPKSTLTERKTEELELPRNMAAAGVFFKCPLISNDILPRDEWKKNIKTFLYEQLEEERGLTACLIIQSCNYNREKTHGVWGSEAASFVAKRLRDRGYDKRSGYSLAQRLSVAIQCGNAISMLGAFESGIEGCVETLCKYLENIINHPTEEKYKKIRMSNRVFTEKVQSVEGSMELLLAAGFEQQQVANNEGGLEDYLVYSGDDVDVENLQTLVDALRSAEPIQLELDRNLQVLLPSQAASRQQLPSSFYALTPEEIKREHQLRAEAIEKSQMLRTKAMREKDELREMRKYKYAIIRIRFPDGILLQGTFSVYEKYIDVHDFVHQNLEHDLPFVLNMPTGHKLSLEEDANKSLIDLRLVPATVLIFAWHSSVVNEINNSPNRDVYLKPEVMILVQEV